MNRYVWIVWIGGGLLGHVAAEMALDDSVVLVVRGDMLTVAHRVVPIVIGVAIAAFGWRASSRTHALAVETP